MSQNLPTRLLELMSDRQWHSRAEIVDKISHRFSATMYVLKKQGYYFEKRHVCKKEYEYRLLNDF